MGKTTCITNLFYLSDFHINWQPDEYSTEWNQYCAEYWVKVLNQKEVCG